MVKFASPTCVRFISLGFLLATTCVGVWMVCSSHSVTTGSRDRANVPLIIIIIHCTSSVESGTCFQCYLRDIGKYRRKIREDSTDAKTPKMKQRQRAGSRHISPVNSEHKAGRSKMQQKRPTPGGECASDVCHPRHIRPVKKGERAMCGREGGDSALGT